METIYLDSNVWDVLHNHGIDLLQEFPRESFSLALVREAEFEISAMPEPLRSFVEAEIERCSIRVVRPFGFYDDRYPADKQRVGGWDQGVWLGAEEHAFRASQSERVGPKLQSKTGLLRNEADTAFAGSSFNSIVLSLNKNRGPLKTAHVQGGRVIFLNDFDPEIHRLGAWVAAQTPGRESLSSPEP